jgi:uncharacterized membrane protein (DUF485 family)
MWALSLRDTFRSIFRVLVGAAIGTLCVYIEAIVVSACGTDLLPDPIATANMAPGVIVGVFSTYFSLGLGAATTRH